MESAKSNNMQNSSTKAPKSTEKRRHYCCVCSNYSGKIVEGRKIKLHRFPASQIVKRVWIRRLKLCYGHYVHSENDRLCSQHFRDGEKTGIGAVPSVFEKKSFNSLTVGDTENPTAATTTTPLTCPNIQEGPTFLHNDHLPTHTSVFFHDYCGLVSQESLLYQSNKCCQTDDCPTAEISTQTSCNISDAGTQTDFVFISDEMQESMPCVKPSSSVNLQISRPYLTIEDICKSDEKVMFYTGVPNSGTFYTLFDEFSDIYPNSDENPGRRRSLRVIDEFFMVLMRLRLGLLLEDLAGRFKISKSSCSNIVSRWIDYLDQKLNFLLQWPDSAVNKLTMPKQFKVKYPRCRVIIDCTEIYTETPQSLSNRSVMYSSYKSHMTYKALIGINPRGVITFASDLWAGSISDKQLTKNCGILDLCEKGDAIMADKGFLIRDLTTPRGIELIIPPFKTKYKCFTRREVEETRRIANLRIHIERAIGRVKNFRILQGNMPITVAGQSSKIWKLCVKLSNLQPPLICGK